MPENGLEITPWEINMGVRDEREKKTRNLWVALMNLDLFAFFFRVCFLLLPSAVCWSTPSLSLLSMGCIVYGWSAIEELTLGSFLSSFLIMWFVLSTSLSAPHSTLRILVKMIADSLLFYSFSSSVSSRSLRIKGKIINAIVCGCSEDEIVHLCIFLFVGFGFNGVKL